LPGAPATRPKSIGEQSVNYGLFLIWLAAVVVGALHHAVWRDEVRALSLALQGQTPGGFFAAIHGEGHPLLWYVLLRGAHAVFPTPLVLPVVALIVAALAMLVLAARSPFSWPTIALVLASHFAVFEYAVMARNYGISVLFIFLFAAAYPSQRGRGVVLGLVLFLLADCNVHSVPLVGALLLFWGLDIVFETGLAWTPAFKVFAVNAAIAAAGVLACALTVLPTFNDAGVPNWAGGPPILPAVKAVLDPGSLFGAITADCVKALFGGLAPWPGGLAKPIEAVMSMLLFGAAIGLVRRPAACVAAFAGLWGLSVLFAVAAPGEYRHEALWIALLIALYWISLDRQRVQPAAPTEGRELTAILARWGGVAFLALLFLQAIPGSLDLIRMVRPSPPWSRSQDLANLIESRPDLRQAIVVAEPDYDLEALPYYIPNRLYLMREHRFGDVVRFTKHAQLDLTLGDVLDNAHRLRAQSGSPVVILLQERLDGLTTGGKTMEAYDWSFSMTPAEIQAFRKATVQLARFGPSLSGEDFDVYEVR